MWFSRRFSRYSAQLFATLLLSGYQSGLIAADSQSMLPSQTATSFQPLASQALVLDIVSNQGTALALGDRGHIFSFDQKWQQVPTPTQVLLTKGFLLTPQLGWAVGHDASILHTQDAGVSWQLQMQSTQIEKPFLDVLFFDSQHGVAIGAYGLFYRTQDGGKHWKSEFHDELLYEEDVAYLEELKQEDINLYFTERSMLLPHFNRIIALADDRLLMVGELGLVAVSSDLGRHWHKQDLGYEGSFFNAIATDSSVYVMGLRGHLFKSSDLSTWQAIPLPVDATLNGAVRLPDDGIRLVGNAGVIIDVDKDAQSQLIQQRQGESLVSIAKLPNGEQWLAGTKGLTRFTPINDNKRVQQE